MITLSGWSMPSALETGALQFDYNTDIWFVIMSNESHLWNRSIIGSRERDRVTGANGGVVRVRLRLRNVFVLKGIRIEYWKNCENPNPKPKLATKTKPMGELYESAFADTDKRLLKVFKTIDTMTRQVVRIRFCLQNISGLATEIIKIIQSIAVSHWQN